MKRPMEIRLDRKGYYFVEFTSTDRSAIDFTSRHYINHFWTRLSIRDAQSGNYGAGTGSGCGALD